MDWQGDKWLASSIRWFAILATLWLSPSEVVLGASAPVFEDKNGYLRFVPPSSWRRVDFPTDPRTKVEFVADQDGSILRIIVRSADGDEKPLMSDISAFMRDRVQLASEMRGKSPITDVSVPKQVNVAGQTGAQFRAGLSNANRMELWHFFAGGLFFNIALTARDEATLERHLPQVKRSLESIMILRTGNPAEAKMQLVARALRLGHLLAKDGKFGDAESALRDGLAVVPGDPRLEEAVKAVLRKQVPPEVGGR